MGYKAASGATEDKTFSWTGLVNLIRPHRTELDIAARPSDGLIVFSAIWGLATILSIAERTWALGGEVGIAIAASQWITLLACLALIARPRQTWLLGLIAAAMAAQYVYRLPVISNNQTIAFFMNSCIVTVLGVEIVRNRSIAIDRDEAYERLRVVARALLAVMYFYGIFHKINNDFLDPNVSCAVSLYDPLARPFGLDQNIVGRYAAIASTFIVELIAMVALYWRRFFWLGLILALMFHYIIPLSAFSWYMDFSCLVFALYVMATPREVSAGLYSTVVALLRSLPVRSPGNAALLTLVALLIVSTLIVYFVAQGYPPRAQKLLWHSSWLVVWAVVGGATMVLLTRAALLAMPYSEGYGNRQPLWLYLFPATLFVTSLSPYLGLKTESSIAMFSNLHTEGGQTNHLLLNPPPYIASYQRSLVRIVDSNDGYLRRIAAGGGYEVKYELARQLRDKPGAWVTYEENGKLREGITGKTIDYPHPSFIESRFLAFKPVDFTRPKVCTH
ncbi:MAG: thiol-disulfide oxidoreductase [Novosphingobium sp.]|nr:thiol-disulfide oxidoreductase [Novosphingobium sp.]MCP5404049.1 thiol-disulfide oxidoreductase [Novosphingobium sp.]